MKHRTKPMAGSNPPTPKQVDAVSVYRNYNALTPYIFLDFAVATSSDKYFWAVWLHDDYQETDAAARTSFLSILSFACVIETKRNTAR